MAGNSARRGARRNPGSKKGAVVGSGGHRSKGLRGRGPTPPATERPGHPAARRAAAGRRSAGETRARETADSSAQRTPPAQRRAGGRSPAHAGTEVVAGRNAVLEALRAGVPATALVTATRLDTDDRVREVLRLASQRDLPLLETTRAELDRLSGGAVHQGVLLQVPPYDYRHPDDLVHQAERAGEPALIVALDGVTDPRNLGAIVRSVAAFGGHGVLVPTRRSAGMTAAAWKTSAGAAARVPVARAVNLTRALVDYQRAGLTVVGLEASGESDLRGLAELSEAGEPLVLVVGSEGKGLSRLVRQTADLIVSIPMGVASESLNASVAAGIALYEAAQARRSART